MASQNFHKTTKTYREFIDYVLNTPRSKQAESGDYNSSQKIVDEDDDFAGTQTFADAVKLANEGWDYGLKELALEDGVAVSGGIEFTPNVMGSLVNMEAYIQGQPDCMFETTEKREYNLEELTVLVPMSYNCDMSVPQTMKFCSSIITLLNKYQATNNVRIIGFFDIDMYEHKTRMVNEVIIKDFDSRFVINNIAFAFHPSFFRRFQFKYMETTELNQWGYGRSIDNDEVVQRIEKEFKSGDRPNTKTILVPQLASVKRDGSFDESMVRKFGY